MRPRSWAEPAALLLAVAALAGCGGSGEPASDARLSVYVSAPLTGSRQADGRAFAAGARLALRDRGREAAGVPVRAVVRDDAAGGAWDPVTVAARARAATEDSTAIAYLGELDPAATRISAPITANAGILQVSADDVAPARLPGAAGRRLDARFGDAAGAAGRGFAAMREALAAIGAADDPTDRASVRHAAAS